MIKEQYKKPILSQKVVQHSNNKTQKELSKEEMVETVEKKENYNATKPIEENKVVNNSNGFFKKQYNITPYEILLPVILPKDKVITLLIEGEWNIIRNEITYRFKDNKGENIKDNSGYLTYRIFPSEDKSPHQLERSNSLTVHKDSFLLLSFNLNKYDNMQLSGSVTITINNTSQYSCKDLFTLIGFPNINSLNYNDQFIESEQIAINLVRANPKLFASLFIERISSDSSKELFNELINMEPLPLLSYSNTLEKISNNLIQDLVTNNTSSQFDSQGNGLKKRVFNLTNVEVNGKDKVVCESILIMKNGYTIIDAIIALLQDELVPSRKNRKYLLNKELKYFGISQMKHERYENLIVIEYSNINFN